MEVTKQVNLSHHLPFWFKHYRIEVHNLLLDGNSGIKQERCHSPGRNNKYKPLDQKDRTEPWVDIKSQEKEGTDTKEVWQLVHSISLHIPSLPSQWRPAAINICNIHRKANKGSQIKVNEHKTKTQT